MPARDTSTRNRPSVEEVKRAVGLAIRAPSIHNTQPWRWVFGADGLDLYADRERQLSAIDPDGRGLLVSCGAALYLARLGLARQGWQTEVARFPDPAEKDLLARIAAVEWRPPDERTRVLAAAAERRRTERRPFRADPVPATLLDELRRLVEGHGVYAHVVERPEERLDLAVVMSWADRLEVEDEAYREELARWVRPDAGAAREGIPLSAVPHLAGEQRHTDVPLRDFEVGRAGDQQVQAGVDEQAAWVVVFTPADDAVARLRAGEAFTEFAVQGERMGLASSAATQAVDLPGVRDRLQVLMDWPDHPQMIFRVGWKPDGEPVPPTPRRPVEDVLTIAGPTQPTG
jgi:nitroreductase